MAVIQHTVIRWVFSWDFYVSRDNAFFTWFGRLFHAVRQSCYREGAVANLRRRLGHEADFSKRIVAMGWGE